MEPRKEQKKKKAMIKMEKKLETNNTWVEVNFRYGIDSIFVVSIPMDGEHSSRPYAPSRS